jgi:hypothetical protein
MPTGEHGERGRQWTRIDQVPQGVIRCADGMESHASRVIYDAVAREGHDHRD